MGNNILKTLEKHESIALTNQNEDLLTIYYKKFFATKKSFLFQLNGKSIDSCILPKTFIKKLNAFLGNGFEVYDI